MDDERSSIQWNTNSVTKMCNFLGCLCDATLLNNSTTEELVRKVIQNFCPSVYTPCLALGPRPIAHGDLMARDRGRRKRESLVAVEPEGSSSERNVKKEAVNSQHLPRQQSDPTIH